MNNVYDCEMDLFYWRRRRAIAAYLLLKRRRNKIHRTVDVCEIFKYRKEQGAYHNLVKEMRLKDEKKFRNYHRMSIEDFDVLLGKVSSIISKMYYAREPILPGEMLSATLRYLATGMSMKSISYHYRFGVSTVSNIIRDTTSAIWEVLNIEYLPIPTEETRKEIANGFGTKWNFPNCVGAIDGKHIRIQAPPNTGSDFFNYKDFFSIVLLAVCDADYCFTAVDIGAKGRQSDGGIFRSSNFGQRFYTNSLNLPPPRKLWEESEPVSYCFIADAAFPFSTNLMRPYPGSFLPLQERIFNYRLSRARRIIENTFEILVAKWRILERPIIAKLQTTEKIVGALICLHNFLKKQDLKKATNIKYCPPNYVDTESETGEIIEGEWRSAVQNTLASVPRMGGNAYARRASAMRSLLMEYFLNISPIDVQWLK